MNFLKDKKNAPIVVGLLSLVAVVAIVLSLYMTGVIGGSGSVDQSAASPAPAASVSSLPAAAPAGGLPGTPSAGVLPLRSESAPGAPSATPKSSVPLGLTKKDPFRLPPVQNADPGRVGRATAASTRAQVPSLSIANYQSRDAIKPPPAASSVAVANPNQRVSGILYSNGVYAILETNGNSEAVRPGQNAEGGRVLSIQSDGLTLLTENNQTVKVPLLPGTPSGGGISGGFPGGGGGYPGGGGFPGGGYPGGGGGGYPGAGGFGKGGGGALGAD